MRARTDVPADWQVVRLEDLMSSFGGLVGKTKKDFGSGDARYVTFLDVVNNITLQGDELGRVNVASDERQSRVVQGDLLLNGSSETPEEVALAAVVDFEPGDDVYLNSFCFGLRLHPGAQADPKFLAYHLRGPVGRAHVAPLAQGATRYNIAKTKLLRLELALPSLAEQQAIATVLGEVDSLIESLGRAIRKKEDVRAGLAQQLLTGRTRLPGFGDDWQVVRLGDHVTYVRTIALSRAQLDEDSAVRYLHYGDIHTRDAVRLDAAAELMPRARAELLGTAGMLEAGDLVFADASEDPDGVGKSVEITATPPEGVVAGLHTIAARFDKEVLADGFKGYLQFIPEFRTALLRLAAGTKVLATTRSYISGIELALPPIGEQEAIATVLADADAEIDLLRRRLGKTRQVREGMMQELLTGRTRLPIEEVAA